ncbi:MAG: M20/M25/M40 family metallo-hydrolase [Deltaproteobacteria bacterium]|nr:M20/M25/M40 family metallo-hydrolase [Deltaproteobacteria bacterium]
MPRPKRLRRALGGAGALLLALVGVLLVRANMPRQPAAPLDVPVELDDFEVDTEYALRALADYVRFDTSAPSGVPRDPSPPPAVTHLLDRYVAPMGLRYEVLEDRILLVVVPGSEPDLAPIVLLSHYDVVPVSDDEATQWTHPPYEGVIADGYLWGRGSIDDKGATICMFEALRDLRNIGRGPRREVRLLIVPDEEIGGRGGSGAIVERHLGVLGEPYLLIDEGSAVLDDIFPGLTLAAVAVAEKRFVTLELSAQGEPGHSSMPRTDAATHVLSRALGRLAEYEEPTRVINPVAQFLDRTADHLPLGKRIALENRWLFGGLIVDQLTDKPATAATVRNTIAITILEGGVKDNVIPARAVATVNLRLLPGSDLDAMLGRIETVIGEPSVDVRVVTDWGDTPVQAMEGERWDRLEAALAATFPEAVVVPMLTPGTTDARYFAQAGIPTFRFLPFTLNRDERSRIHGIDERISIENVEQGIRAYAYLMSLL